MSTMMAIQFHETGGPEVLRYESVPRPTPRGAEILVDVYAAGVNPLDWKVRAGQMHESAPHLPKIPGWDFSGVVADIGSRTLGYKVGDEVYGRPDPQRNGAYAEAVVVRPNELARKPRTLDHVAAAAVPLAGLTAWQSLFRPEAINLKSGETVLIHGAAGGVGTYAVQLAKWRGAKVVGTASPEHHALLRELGVDVIVDYNQESFADIGEVDAVLDTIGGETQDRSWHVTKPGGVLVGLVGVSTDNAEAYGVRAVSFMSTSHSGDLEELAKLIDQGHLRPIVATVLPLSRAADAHALSETGHTQGKIVLKVRPEASRASAPRPRS